MFSSGDGTAEYAGGLWRGRRWATEGSAPLESALASKAEVELLRAGVLAFASRGTSLRRTAVMMGPGASRSSGGPELEELGAGCVDLRETGAVSTPPDASNGLPPPTAVMLVLTDGVTVKGVIVKLRPADEGPATVEVLVMLMGSDALLSADVVRA